MAAVDLEMTVVVREEEAGLMWLLRVDEDVRTW